MMLKGDFDQACLAGPLNVTAISARRA